MSTNRKPIIFILGAIVAILVLGGWYYMGTQRVISAVPDESASERVILVTPQSTPTVEVVPTEEASPSATVAPTSKASPTKSESPTKAAATAAPTKAAASPTTAASATPTP